MASIDASTSGAGGVITTADNTGILQLKSGGTTIATVSSTGLALNTGNITLPSGAAPAFYAYLGSQQSISANTNTKIALSSELFDTSNCFDSSTNYRFTPTVAGYYQILGNARIISSAASNKVLHIYKNGNQFISSDTYAGTSGNLSQYMSFTTSGLVYLNGSTDYLELWGYSNGSSVSFDGGGGGANTAPWQTFMSGFLARSA